MVESLLGGACGGARGGDRRNFSSSDGNHRRHDTSYANAVSPPNDPALHPLRNIPEKSAPSNTSEWRLVQRWRSPPTVSMNPPATSSPPASDPPVSLKRRRSPGASPSCAKCFRTGHAATECRHLLFPPGGAEPDITAPVLKLLIPRLLINTTARPRLLQPSHPVIRLPAPLLSHPVTPSLCRSLKTFFKPRMT